MKITRLVGVALGITAAVGFGFMAAGAGMPQAQAAPVANVCPNTAFLSNGGDCDTEFVLNSNGTLTTLSNSMVPYENSDDQLIGVINNDPSINITGLTLTGPSGLFGFDGDGICTYAPGNGFGNTPATPAGILSYCSGSQIGGTDPQDYQGPDNTFSNINANQSSGQANFNTPILNGQSTFFSLELSPSAAGSIGVGLNPTPEPGTLALLGPMALALLPMLRRRRFRK